MGWADKQESPIVVPAKSSYTVHVDAPYHYELKLKTGHQIKIARTEKHPEIIAYFEASPNYPWWYTRDILNLSPTFAT